MDIIAILGKIGIWGLMISAAFNIYIYIKDRREKSEGQKAHG